MNRWKMLCVILCLLNSFIILWIHDVILPAIYDGGTMAQNMFVMMDLLSQIKHFCFLMEIVSAIPVGITVGLIILEYITKKQTRR